jgi:formate hydrogenlyase subunit 3/multisubunit Na+/H+ antiporter MnhD subunit
LAVVFIGMATAVLRMAQGGRIGGSPQPDSREPVLSIVPPLVLAVLVLIFGLYIPPALRGVIAAAAQSLG